MKEMTNLIAACLKNANEPAAVKPRWTVEELPSSTEPTTTIVPQTQVFAVDPTIYHRSSLTKDTYVHDAPKADLIQPPQWASKLFANEGHSKTSNKIPPEWAKLFDPQFKTSKGEHIKYIGQTDQSLSLAATQQSKIVPPPIEWTLPTIPPTLIEEVVPELDGLLIRMQPIPEDSLCRKILTCVPLIGIYTYFKNNNSLEERINGTQDHVLRAEYTRIQNHYKIADIIQKCLTVAIIVSAVALTILTSMPVLGAGIIAGTYGLGAAIMSYQAYRIYKNKQYMQTVRMEFRNRYVD